MDVTDALRRLSPNEREVMQLVVWDGLSAAETAEVLGCSVNVVQVRLHRARRRLVRRLRAASGESDGVVASVIPATAGHRPSDGYGEPTMRTDIERIDALVKRADPVDPLSLAGPDSLEAEDIWERVQAAMSLGTDASPISRPRPRRARRLALPVMGVGAAAAVVILVLQLLPSPALQSPSAAAAVLGHLARKAAAAEPPPILKGDQWLQSEFRGLVPGRSVL